MGFLKRWFGREEETWQTSSSSPSPSAPTVKLPSIMSSETQNVVLTGDDARRAMESIETATGRDLDGDGRIGAGGTDLPSQLERLAKLRDSGALTDEEFESEKAKLLSGGPPTATT